LAPGVDLIKIFRRRRTTFLWNHGRWLVESCHVTCNNLSDASISEQSSYSTPKCFYEIVSWSQYTPPPPRLDDLRDKFVFTYDAKTSSSSPSSSSSSSPPNLFTLFSFQMEISFQEKGGRCPLSSASPHLDQSPNIFQPKMNIFYQIYFSGKVEGSIMRWAGAGPCKTPSLCSVAVPKTVSLSNAVDSYCRQTFNVWNSFIYTILATLLFLKLYLFVQYSTQLLIATVSKFCHRMFNVWNWRDSIWTPCRRSLMSLSLDSQYKDAI